MANLEINLHGLRILNTRPLHQASSLSQLIEAANGKVLSCPALEIIPTPPTWVETLPLLAQFNYVIFTSTNAVNYFFAGFNSFNWPKLMCTTAIGKATALALENYNIHVDFIPSIATSEQLLMLKPFQECSGKNVLLVKGKGGRDVISTQLNARNAQITELAVYQRILPKLNSQQLKRWWREDALDIILITSNEAMQNLFLLFEKISHEWLKQKTWVVISERLMDEAKALGIKHVKLCNHETIIKSLQELIKD